MTADLYRPLKPIESVASCIEEDAYLQYLASALPQLDGYHRKKTLHWPTQIRQITEDEACRTAWEEESESRLGKMLA